MAASVSSSCCDVISLKALEDEVVDALMSCDLEALSREAAEIGVIPVAVKKSLDSMAPSVPHPRKLRYLLLQAYRQLEVNSKLVESWVKVVVKHGVSKALFGRACKPVAKGEDTMSKAEFCFYEQHVSVLTEILADYGSEWRSMSTWLNLPRGVKKSISARLHMLNDRDCMCEVLEEWILGGHEHAKAPTLGNLKKALGSKTVGLFSEAHELEDNLLKHGVCFKHPASLSITEDGAVDKPEPSTPLIEIISQSVDISVAEEKSTLLEVQAGSTRGGTVSYQWLKDGAPLTDDGGHYLGNTSSILCVYVSTLASAGTYTCTLSESEHQLSSVSQPIVVTVSLPHFKRVLVDKYAQFDVHRDVWPPVGNKTYINLALVKLEGFNKADEYSYSTIQGDIDDIVYKKENIEYDVVFRKHKNGAFVLIEGRPGSGKTTLVHKISRDWAKGKPVLAGTKLLFLVPLRLLSGKGNFTMEDLLKLFYQDSEVAHCVLKRINQTNGEGVCFIFDGLDEYKEKESVVFNLIRKDCLQQAMVIVSSRPSATVSFRLSAYAYVEVVGFLRKQIFEYIENYPFVVNGRATELLSYLTQHPNILHMCYLPVHVAMVSYLHDRMKGNMPHTECGIYTRFTMFTLLRKGPMTGLRSLDDLSGDQRNNFMKICKLAFDMTLSHVQIFSEEELSLCIDIDDPSLGLVTIDHTAGVYGYHNLYSFVHLTFQEYLAAHHMSRLGEQEQSKVLRTYSKEKHMKVVCKFYCGLVSFEEPVGDRFLDIVAGVASFLFPCQCAFEAQQTSICTAVVSLDSCRFFFEGRLTPADATAISYVLSNSTVALRSLTMDGVMDQTPISTYIDILMLCGGLQHLIIEKVQIDDEGAMSIGKVLKQCSQLEELRLKLNWIGDEGAKGLGEGIKYCTSLRILSLGTNQIGDEGAKGLGEDLKRCSQLEELRLEWNHIGDEGAKGLGEGIKYCTSLRILSLGANQIGDEGAKGLGEDLKRCSQLEVLRLHKNRIGDEGAKGLSEGLKQCIQLEELCLYDNLIGNEGAKGLGEGIKYCTSLRILSLGTNQIGDEGAKDLGEGLKQCSQLEVLYLYENQIGDEGAKDLGEGLKQCSQLKELYLDENHIGDEGAKCLGEGIKYCTSLRILSLDTNQIGDEGAKGLGESLKQCCQLEELYLDKNQVGDEGAKGLGKGLKQLQKLLI